MDPRPSVPPMPATPSRRPSALLTGPRAPSPMISSSSHGSSLASLPSAGGSSSGASRASSTSSIPSSGVRQPRFDPVTPTRSPSAGVPSAARAPPAYRGLPARSNSTSSSSLPGANGFLSPRAPSRQGSISAAASGGGGIPPPPMSPLAAPILGPMLALDPAPMPPGTEPHHAHHGHHHHGGHHRRHSTKETVQVTVRMRPLNEIETKTGTTVAWDVDSADARVRGALDAVGPGGKRVHLANAPLPEYQYDHAFDGSANAPLYVASVRQLVHSAMDGYNGTVFAYGQTASGKTYTMMGTDREPGVIPLAIHDVFQYIKMSEGQREFLLRVSYLEIYNETIRDLLSPETTDLRIHEDKRRGVYVSPLKEDIVTHPSQVMRAIHRGEANRHISETDYNEHSSRSHTLFQMVIESRDARTNGQVKISLLNLIDLAGSEKAVSNADRRKEGAFINKSLLTLGTVISKLTEEKATHIPYRDSKLTRILQSSLSGNARVSVICTISPSSGNVEESTNTLKFAARVKKVVTRAHTNTVLDDKALLQQYRKEIMELKDKLQQTNEALARERHEELMQIKAEKEKALEELHNQQLLRTALKERIDHLTRLILTSGSISQVQVGPGAVAGNGASATSPLTATGPPNATPSMRIEALNNELVGKDVELTRLQSVAHDLQETMKRYAPVVTALQKGDTSRAVQLAKALPSADGTLSAALSRSTSASDLGGSLDSLDVNTEIVHLKQKNRELEIVVADTEDRYVALAQDYDRAVAEHAVAQRGLQDEVRALKATVADLKNQLRKAEVQAFVAVETQQAVAELQEQFDEEIARRKAEKEAHERELNELKEQLALARSELVVSRLTS
ncbi:hypothetical protein GGF32_009582 [Allomyces javanicus]|nr:hypothetical protein GGF32_009582 [Allomyces javanicus]